MYYVTEDLGNGKYNIIDTNDGKIDPLTTSEINLLIKKGVKIEGVTKNGIFVYDPKSDSLVKNSTIGVQAPPASVVNKNNAALGNPHASTPKNAEMLLWVIAQLRDIDNNNKGYRILRFDHGNPTCYDMSIAKIVSLIASGYTFQNAVYNEQNQDLDFPNCKLANIPVLQLNNNDKKLYLRGRAGITVLYRVVNDKNTTVGFGVVDTFGFGALRPISIKKLLQLAAEYNRVNFNVVPDMNPNGYTIKAKTGEFPVVPLSEKPEYVQSFNSKTDSPEKVKKIRERNDAIIGERKIKSMGHQDDKSSVFISSGSLYTLPTIKVYGVSDVLNSEYNNASQDSLLLAVTNLNKVSPYYASVLQTISRVATSAIPTMGVTEDRMYYNPAFVSSLSKAEITFVLIHEMLHIILQHTIRRGNRNAELWNIATDLYVNEMICKDFGVAFGDVNPVKVNPYEDSRGVEGELQAPPFGVYLATLDESLDFGVDTVETIYNRLIADNPDMASSGQSGQQGQQSQNQQGQQGQQGQNQQGQQGQNQQGQQGQGQQGQQGDGEQGQGQGQSQGQGQQGQGEENGQSGEGQGQGQGQGQSQGQGSSSSQGQKDGSNSSAGGQNGQEQGDSLESDVGEGSGSQSNIDNLLEETDNADYQEIFKEIEVIYKGKKLRAKVPLDIFSNNEDQSSADAKERAANQSKNALVRIKTKIEIDEKKAQKTFSSASTILADRYIHFGLASKYDWIQLLKNVCKTEHKKLYTYTRLNKPYQGVGIALPSKVDLGKPEKITDIKFCVDVSGSVTQEELNSIFTKISDILDVYKLDAEMIYWDTQVTNVGSFNNLKQLIQIKPKGFGGTDPNCVFQYLTRETDFRGEKEKSLVKNISAVLIFTDGCFGNINTKYAPYFNKNTIWVLNEGSAPFIAPFGKVAVRRD